MGKYMDWQEDEGRQGVKREEDLHNSEFWITMDSMRETNDAMYPLHTATPTPTDKAGDDPTVVTIKMHLQDISMLKWQLISQM